MSSDNNNNTSFNLSNNSNNKLNIPTKMDNTDSDHYIIDHVKKLQSFAYKNDRKNCLDNFGFFFEKYPALFNMITDDPNNFDYNRLYEMLALRRKISKNEIKYEDASIYMGQKYYKEFVADKVSNNNNNNDNNK